MNENYGMAKYVWTPEPWAVEDLGRMAVSIIGLTRVQDQHWNNKHYLGSLFHTKDMHRAVACVNACAGMSDPAAEIAALRSRITRLKDAAGELLEVADLRGDSSLPSPPDDPKLWTARMQSAWDELRAIVEEA